jgi:hypothetical protein
MLVIGVVDHLIIHLFWSLGWVDALFDRFMIIG